MKRMTVIERNACHFILFFYYLRFLVRNIIVIKFDLIYIISQEKVMKIK